MIALLRRRDFALLWLGGLAGLIGPWMMRTAVPLFVYRETGSTLATGGTFIAAVLPGVLLGSVAGVFVDRWDRKRTLVAANLLRALLILPLIAVRGPEGLWIVYVVAFTESSVGLFFATAENALLPRLVGEDDLVAANALNALNNNLARLTGPPLGGALYALGGLGVVAFLDAVLYVVGAGLISLIAGSHRPSERAAEAAASPGGAWTRAWREWAAGLRLVRGNRVLCVLFGITALAALGEGLLGSLFVPFVTEVLAGDELYLGWLMTAQAVGSIAGGVLIGRLAGKLPPARLLGVCAVAFGLGDLALFNARSVEALLGVPRLPFALGAILLVGVPAVGFHAGYLALMQAGTEDEYRGRVFGALATTEALLLIVGLLLSGVLGGIVGIVPVLSADSALYVLAGVVALTLLPAAVRPPEPEVGAEVAPAVAEKTA